MPTVITPLITDAGLDAALNASNDGLDVRITHVVLGQGQFTPSGATSAPMFRKEKAVISGAAKTGVGSFLVSVYLPSYTSGAPYSVGEIHFYAGDPDAGGILFAAYSAPGASLFQRNSLDWVGQFALTLARVPAGSVNVTVDPGGALALALMTQHEANPDPHRQYIRHYASSDALPVVDRGPIWHAGYDSIMVWRAFTANGANYAGYTSVDIGWLRADTQPTTRNAWVKTGINGLPTTLALYHWAKHHGLMKTPAQWAAGTLFYRDNGDGTFATPDVRGEHPRFWDDNRNVVSGQTFGSWLDSMVGSHSHQVHVGYGEGDNTYTVTNGWDSGVFLSTLATGGFETRGRSTAFPGVIKT